MSTATSSSILFGSHNNVVTTTSCGVNQVRQVLLDTIEKDRELLLVKGCQYGNPGDVDFNASNTTGYYAGTVLVALSETCSWNLHVVLFWSGDRPAVALCSDSGYSTWALPLDSQLLGLTQEEQQSIFGNSFKAAA